MKSEDEVKIRRLRKKLRQIENLERLDRALSNEEELKVSHKQQLRSELLELLSSLSQDGMTTSTFHQMTDEDTSLNSSWSQDESSQLQDDSSLVQDDRSQVQDNSSLVQDDRSQVQDDSSQVQDDRSQVQDDSSQVQDDRSQVQDDSSQVQDDRSQVPDGSSQGQEDSSQVQDDSSPCDDPQRGNVTYPLSVTDEEKMKRLVQSSPEIDRNVITVRKVKQDSKQHSEKLSGHQQEKASKQVDRLRELQRDWATSQWSVTKLEGHSDLICSVSLSRQWLLTGSRDTTVKLWDVLSGEEIRSMGGHSESVTAVVLLSPEQAVLLLKQLASQVYNEEILIGLSASQDCSIKIWNLNTGGQLRSFYTYSPLTRLVFVRWDEKPHLLSGSAGGKIELWDVESGTSSSSLRVHEDSVTGLEVLGCHVYSCSSDGTVSVCRLRDGELHVIFVSENVRLMSGIPAKWRPLRCLAATEQATYLGDDAMNLKVLDWQNGVLHKLSNHTNDFGATDALHVIPDLHLLLSSGYDLDNGLGFLNIRHLPDEKYLCSLCDEKTSRIIAIDCVKGNGDTVTIVTGGMELSLWRWISKWDDRQQDRLYRAQYVTLFSRPARHSDTELSDDEDACEEDEELSEEDEELSEKIVPGDSGVSPPFVLRRFSTDDKNTWLSWCSVL